MNDTELTAAFSAALAEYESVPFRPPIDRGAAQFFFFRGYGAAMDNATAMHAERLRPTEAESEIDGHPV